MPDSALSLWLLYLLKWRAVSHLVLIFDLLAEPRPSRIRADSALYAKPQNGLAPDFRAGFHVSLLWDQRGCCRFRICWHLRIWNDVDHLQVRRCNWWSFSRLTTSIDMWNKCKSADSPELPPRYVFSLINKFHLFIHLIALDGTPYSE